MNAIYAGVAAEVLLDNEHVLVHRVLVPPGKSTGAPVHGGNQLQVFITGGVLESVSSGRATLWKPGRVRWHAAAEENERGWTNVGASSVAMVWVGLKAQAGAGGNGWAHLDYPAIPGEDLLENERLIVQRFVVAPGQWEGVHAHRANTLYIHIKGGKWSARSCAEPEHAYDAPALDGEVGWMPRIDISAGHESGNTGTEPIDLIWVSLKG
jgi:hypothetical protein